MPIRIVKKQNKKTQEDKFGISRQRMRKRLENNHAIPNTIPSALAMGSSCVYPHQPMRRHPEPPLGGIKEGVSLLMIMKPPSVMATR
jgi:hypothetical protein